MAIDLSGDGGVLKEIVAQGAGPQVGRLPQALSLSVSPCRSLPLSSPC
jgi:hypothetical protein